LALDFLNTAFGEHSISETIFVAIVKQNSRCRNLLVWLYWILVWISSVFL